MAQALVEPQLQIARVRGNLVMSPASADRSVNEAYPDNPVLLCFTRGDAVESQVRGTWVLVDSHGSVLDGAGHFEAPYFVRSAIKCVQALPLVESGAAEQLQISDAEVALVVASHSGEPCHTEGVVTLLGRVGLQEQALHCGAHPPFDPASRRALEDHGTSPTALHNNCSGKHAGFLALERYLGGETDRYLDPESRSQRAVLQAVLELTELDRGRVSLATDGCSAPTFRLPLTGLARAFARFAAPTTVGGNRRAAIERIARSVSDFPHLVAGNHGRLCTELVRESSGNLFPKVGAEAVYAIGNKATGQALALKADDGEARSLHTLVVRLLDHLGWLGATQNPLLARSSSREIKNFAGLSVGRVDFAPHGDGC